MKKQPLLRLRELPSQERPRERLLQHGAEQLSNSELLAILLRTGTNHENVLQLASRILARFSGVDGLAEASATQLKAISGLGDAKATQILAALELAKRLNQHVSSNQPRVQNASDVVKLLQDMRHLKQEQVRIILLDTAQHVKAIRTMTTGTVNASLIRVAELFREPIVEQCPAIILVHNHPSGDPTPSHEDKHITKAVVEAGDMLDIDVVDHIIIGNGTWYSFREAGQLR
ncbi:MAG: DNA repair protein RadC [Anaerolineae bacterium]|nr:DNA repair protein RadC [Anaerolineae bacterium]